MENVWGRKLCNFQCLCTFLHFPSLGAWLPGLKASWNNAAVWPGKANQKVPVHLGAAWKLIAGHCYSAAMALPFLPWPLQACGMVWTLDWAVWAVLSLAQALWDSRWQCHPCPCLPCWHTLLPALAAHWYQHQENLMCLWQHIRFPKSPVQSTEISRIRFRNMHVQEDSISIWLPAYPEQNSTARSTNRQISRSIVQGNCTPGPRQGLERVQESTTDKDLHVLWSIILLRLPSTVRVAPPAIRQRQNQWDYLDV